MNRLRWGIIGTGRIAKTFAQNLAASRTGRLVAVGSRSPQTAQQFGDQFNLSPAHRHASYDALLADADVQAVYISTPHPWHAEWAIRAAQAGKHILCEKPLTMNHAEAVAVVEAARANNVFLMEAFMYRCHPQTTKLVELLREKTVGEVRLIQVAFSFQAKFAPGSRLFAPELGGGGILDVGCYTVSMARLVAGAEPVEVHGCAHLGQTGVDEWATAILKFPGDVLGQLSTGLSLHQEPVVRIFGSTGRIVVPNPWITNRTEANTERILLYRNATPEEIIVPSHVTSFTLEADVVGDAVAAGRLEASPPAMTWADSLGNMRTLDRWRQAVGLRYPGEPA
jgi:predicted dehydrogenase